MQNIAFESGLTLHIIALIFVCSPFRLGQLYLNGQLLSIQAKEQWGAQDQSWTVEVQVLASQCFCFHPSSAALPRPLFPTFIASSWQSPTMSRASMSSLVGKPRDGLLSFFPQHIRDFVYCGSLALYRIFFFMTLWVTGLFWAHTDGCCWHLRGAKWNKAGLSDEASEWNAKLKSEVGDGFPHSSCSCCS